MGKSQIRTDADYETLRKRAAEVAGMLQELFSHGSGILIVGVHVAFSNQDVRMWNAGNGPAPNCNGINCDGINRLAADVADLCSENAFLRQIITDLQQESTAYERGVRDGARAEREKQEAFSRRIADALQEKVDARVRQTEQEIAELLGPARFDTGPRS